MLFFTYYIKNASSANRKKSGFPAEPDSKTRTPNHMLAKHIVFFTIISRPTFYTLEEPGIDCKGARIRYGLGLEFVGSDFEIS